MTAKVNIIPKEDLRGGKNTGVPELAKDGVLNMQRLYMVPHYHPPLLQGVREISRCHHHHAGQHHLQHHHQVGSDHHLGLHPYILGI